MKDPLPPPRIMSTSLPGDSSTVRNTNFPPNLPNLLVSQLGPVKTGPCSTNQPSPKSGPLHLAHLRLPGPASTASRTKPTQPNTTLNSPASTLSPDQPILGPSGPGQASQAQPTFDTAHGQFRQGPALIQPSPAKTSPTQPCLNQPNSTQSSLNQSSPA